MKEIKSSKITYLTSSMVWEHQFSIEMKFIGVWRWFDLQFLLNVVSLGHGFVSRLSVCLMQANECTIIV